MTDPTWTSILPPLLAICLALLTRQVFISLFAGIWLGAFLLPEVGIIASLGESIDRLIGVLASPGDARVIVFNLVIGAFICMLERNGAVSGLVRFLERAKWVTNAARAQWMAFVIGLMIFIESNITMLVTGTVSRPLFDRYKISRQKLAYIIDSTAAPICILIPLNAWGAFNLAILESLQVEDALRVFISSIPLNLYAICAVLLTAFSISRNFNPGSMAQAEDQAHKEEGASTASLEIEEDDTPPRAINMFLPILVLIGTMPIGLLITGEGDLLAGSGSTSVLWASLAALTCISLMSLFQRNMKMSEVGASWSLGAGRMLPISLVLLLALALGGIVRELGTGAFIASLIADWLPIWILPCIIFLVSALIAFSVGTSWGTFSIMLPISITIAVAIGAEPAHFVAAVLSGGIFGDHSSPISDTTIVAIMASGSDHVEHVRTQLPYALIAGGVSAIGFLVLGFGLL
ncbi:MAG: C4-dicarboxylate ABC transporter [Porticoccaceae bacterium]|nr:C4-dicarboxylate ABC transporter [Porticoccaceae bacterium]